MLKSIPVTLLFLILFSSCVFAQEIDTSYWRRAFKAGLNVNQSSFSNNWKGGGTNSIALGSFLNAKANYEKAKITFANELELLYGIIKNEDRGARKTTDRIFFDSKLGYKLQNFWSLYASVNLQSQFDLGYRYYDTLSEERKVLISKFFSPAYLTSSLGLEYKPVDFFWIRFGVGTFRQTFVGDKFLYRNEPKNYGVPIGKTVRNELAFQLLADLDKNIAPNLNLKTRFLAFANYETLSAIDTRLDIVLTAKVNRFVNVNLSATALYDQDMDYDIQYSQSLALGILYNFSEFPDNK